MRRVFVSNLILVLFLNFLVKPLWVFGIDLTVQNRVGEEAYGLYFAIFNFSLLFNILLDLGLTHYNNQAVARDKVEVVRNFSFLTSLKFFLGLLYLLVTLTAGYFIGYQSFAFKLLAVLSVNQFLASLVLFLRSNLSGLHFFRLDSLLSVTDKTLMILICGLLLFTPIIKVDFTVLHFALAQFVSYFLTVVIAFSVAVRKARIFRFKFDIGYYRSGLKSSFPYALLILMMALYTRVDGVMLDRMAGSFESGVYAAAFRLLDMVNQMGYLVGVLLLPMFSGMLARKENVSSLVRLSFSLIYVATIALSLSCSFWSDEIMHELYLDNAELSSPVFRLLILSSIAFGSTYVFGTLLTANQKLRTLNVIAITGFLVNVILNYILIPHYGAKGAATATVITQFGTSLVQAFYCFKLFHLVLKDGFWLRVLIFTAAAFAVSYLLYHFIHFNWLILFVANFLLLMFTAVSLKLFELKAAIDLLKRRFS